MSHHTSTPKDWGKLTVTELKDELQARGLPTTGKKAELVDRLKASKDAAAELLEDTEEVENTLVSPDEVSQLDEDIAILTQEEYQDNTNEDTAFVTAVDDSESGSQEKDSVVLVKERDDAMSKADSLTVNLDQDIASLGDLEEKQSPEDSVVETTDSKAFSKTEVVIDAVGEVDDDEFGAVVASMEDAAEETKVEVKKDEEKPKEEKAEEKSKKELPPLPSQPMNSWMVKQFAIAKRFSCLYIRPLTAVDVLCEAVVEWANRAVYFCINHERDGKGLAVLNFITEKECKEAKEALTASLADTVKVLHPSRDMEEEIKQAACYKVECPNLATRTLVLEDAPPDTTEDQVCLLFPGAISVSRPEVSQPVYEWQKQQYALPDSVKKIFVIEFGFPKAASKALAEEYELEGQKLKMMTMQQFQKNYRDYCNKKAEEERLRRKAEAERQRREREKKAAEQVFSDDERIELCKALKEIVSKRSFVLKRNDLPWNDRMMQKEKLSSKLMDIVRALDTDSDKRVNLGMGFPEPEKLMTRNTKKLFQRNPKLRRASEHKEPSKSHKKSESKKESDTKKESAGKDISLKITVSTGGDTKREVEKSDKEASVKKAEAVEDTADDVVIVSSSESKPVEEIEIKDDEEEGKQEKVTVETEEQDLAEGADMEMGDEGSEVRQEVDVDSEVISEVVEEVFGSKPEDTKKSKRSPKKEERKEGKKDEEKHERKEVKDTKKKKTHSARESEQLRQEMAKLEEDKRGWWSVAQERKNLALNRTDYERIYKKFGKVMEVHVTEKKIFVRFNSRSGASGALREYWGSSRNVSVPPVIGLWKKSGSGDDRFRLKEDRGRSSGSRDRNRDTGSRDRRGSKEIPSLLNNNSSSAFQANANPLAVQLQQQVQQQMLMQQQLQQQQQQQMALLQLQQQQQQQSKFQSQQSMGEGLLGAAPQSLLSGGDSRSSGRTGGSTGGIPSLFGVTGVPPVRRSSPERGFGKSRRRSLSPPQRGHSPSRKVLLPSSFDAKRPRLDDSLDYGFHGSDNRGYGADTDHMAASSNPANPVADMLKGLSQVISSKMEEISRIGGPVAGEQAVSDVMQSISSMQKNLIPSRDVPEPQSRLSRIGGAGSGLGDSNYGSLRGLSGSHGLGSASGLRSQLGSGGGSGSLGGVGGYGDSQRMYSKFNDSSSGGGVGRSSQVLDYAHQSRKGLLDPGY